MTRIRLPDLTIKRLGPHDVEILEALLNLFKPKQRPTLERLEHLLGQPDALYFAALLRNQPVGWALAQIISRFTVDECFLYDIAVAPIARRQGIATAMVGSLQQFASQRGISEIYALTEAAKEDARGLFAGSGAHPDPRQKLIYRWDLRA